MSKEIQKLNKLKTPKSFIQTNIVKGFKYIDKAGEIVNNYTENRPPKFNMGLRGLTIENPKEKVDQLKVSPEAVWMGFSEIDSLDMVSDLYEDEALKIFSILDIGKVKRVGWRNYFVYEFDNKKKHDNYFQSLVNLENGSPLFLKIEIQPSEDFDANLRIQSVVKNDESDTSGVLFDIDLFQREEMNAEEVPERLQSFRDYLDNEGEFLELLNSTFK